MRAARSHGAQRVRRRHPALEPRAGRDGGQLARRGSRASRPPPASTSPARSSSSSRRPAPAGARPVTGSGAEPRRRAGSPATGRSTIGGVTVAPGTRRAARAPGRAAADRHVAVAVGRGRQRPAARARRCGCRASSTATSSTASRSSARCCGCVQPTRRSPARSSPCRSSTCSGSSTRAATCPTGATSTASFPGSPRGSLTAQLAHRFVTEIVPRCDAGIDFHTGSDHRTNLPQLRVDLVDPGGRADGARRSPRRSTVNAAVPRRLAAHVVLAPGHPGARVRGRRGQPLQRGRRSRVGVDGTLRVLAELGMWRGEPPAAAGRRVRGRALALGAGPPVRASCASTCYPGQRVERGEVLGIIADALGDRPTAGAGADARHRARLHPAPDGEPGRRPRAHRRHERGRTRRRRPAAGPPPLIRHRVSRSERRRAGWRIFPRSRHS